MTTMIVKQEVEATPKLVAEALKKFALTTVSMEFPHAKGTLVTIQPEVLKALQGVAGMPGLVLMRGKGSSLGMVAIHKADGDITVTFLAPQQVVEVYTLQA